MIKPPRELKIGFAGFVIALVGAVAGFGGFYVEQRWLSVVGFFIVVAGVTIGFVAISYGWYEMIREGRVMSRSLQAAQDMRRNIIQFWSRLWNK